METIANCQLLFSGFLLYGGKLNHYVNWGNYIILMVALPNNTIRFREAQMAKQILWAFLQSVRAVRLKWLPKNGLKIFDPSISLMYYNVLP